MKKIMKQNLKERLPIRYIKLHFILEMLVDTTLPQNKASAIRGGMGQMLLRANCIKNAKCEVCDFVSDCIVQKAMYSKLEITPQFMQSNDSVGYVIECENYQENFQKGERWEFNLLLFGKTLCYFNIYMQAIYSLGMEGLGKNHSQFRIVKVTNSKRESLLDEYGNIYMEYYKIGLVEDYVLYRKKQIEKNGWKGCLRFKAPLALKYKNERLYHFNMESLLLACARRIYMLNCLENLGQPQYQIDLTNIPLIEKQTVVPVSVSRYSNRHNSKMYLKGIRGELWLESLTEEQLILLLAGELIHVGKHTSFGFGRFHLL